MRVLRVLSVTLLALLYAASARADVSVRAGVGYLSATASGNSTVTEPASCASGDVELALALADSGTSLTAPTGWTQLYAGTQGSMMYDVSYVARGGSAPSLTWSVTGSSKYREIHILCLTSSTAGTISLDSSATGATGSAINHPPDPPSTTAVASASLAICGGINYAGSGAGGWTAPTNYTRRTDNTVGNDGVMASRSLVASGAENPGAFSASLAGGLQDYYDGFTATWVDTAGGGGGGTHKKAGLLLGVYP